MIYAVWIPLLVPLLAVPVARRVAGALAPRVAAWTLAQCGVLLAGCSTAVLGLLALGGVLRLAPVATLGHLSPRWLGDHTWLTAPGAWAAATLLLAGTARAAWVLVGHWRQLRSAHEAAGPGGAGDLSVSPDPYPYAYALPGVLGGRGRVVVSAAMLRILRPDEREALFAHERAHLAGRHHLFLGVGQLAAALHPALRGLREPLTYALERWADEAAAEAVGDRRLAARAIGRAALAAHEAKSPDGCPVVALGVASSPVPRRVAALLGKSEKQHGRRGKRAQRTVAVVLMCCLAASTASALHAAHDLHGTVETAQSETHSR
ncbi:M56 family metallopeptidase [Streptomyces sp. NPDC059740]|uniref:M56 family metallopeptidase n=1 Tax=Streptomyces sp. NPDC059740 TaxID=3346926 RepID=UPI00364D9A7B